MLISSRLIVPAVIVFALTATNGPLAAQLSTAARGKPLATPLPGPDTGSLQWLLGKPEDDAVKRGNALPASCALQQCDASVYCFPGTNSACLIQTFPDIQWRICIQASAYGTATSQNSRGISIGPVDIRRNLLPTTLWQRVIYRAEVAENATPYNDGTHLSDDQFANWSNWRRTVTAADANGGALITLSKDGSFGPAIVGECRDQGPGWLCKGKRGAFVRRSQELVLWGIYDAGNYDYIQEFGFHDDGTISLRTGATGYLNPERPEVAHLHDSLWRIDLDINGAAGDSAFLTGHLPVLEDPTGLTAQDLTVPFNEGVEGAADWQPEQFSTLIIQDTALNAAGRPMGYELQPLRTGSARHFGATEKWTLHDFWVTRLRPTEDTRWAVVPPGTPFVGPDGFLLPYVADQQSVMNGDLVVWYLASAHHDPISEDLDVNQKPAVTLVHWYGLDLKPHDFFDFNPLGGPLICD